MLNTQYLYLVNRLYKQTRNLIVEYKAFDPSVTRKENGKSILEELYRIHKKLAFTSVIGEKQFITITG